MLAVDVLTPLGIAASRNKLSSRQSRAEGRRLSMLPTRRPRRPASRTSVQPTSAVYEPSDDLLVVVAADAERLRSLSAGVCIEIGCGSGAVVTHLAKLLPVGSAVVLASDVNPNAIDATAATARQNGMAVQLVQMDLLSALRPGVVDVLVFNPPYVPTSEEELQHALDHADISAAWAGGPRGRLVLDRLLPQLGTLLSPRGVFYLLGVRENAPDEIAALLREQGFTARTIAERRAQNERLFVMAFSREGAGGEREATT